jgi:opacity protein-like surface antigen
VSVATLLCGLFASREARADRSSTSPEQGYDLGDMQNPRSMAFGGAQTALGVSTVAIYENPANLPLAHVYHFEGLAALSPEARRQSYGGAVVDSNTSRLAGGFAGTWNIMDPDGIHRTWTDLRVTLAYPLGDRVSAGVTGRYLRAAQSLGEGPFGASYASDGTNGSPILNQFTFDLGASVTPIQGLHIGLVGKNLTNPGTGLAPTQVKGGVGYTTETFSVEADGLADFTTWTTVRGRIMAGGELFIAQHFPIRLGYRYDDGVRTHAVSAGLGYVDRKWSFEISARRDVVGDNPSTMIGASIRYFYEAGAANAADEGDPIGY